MKYEYTKAQCDRWTRNKVINPRTGYQISPTKKLYFEIAKGCHKYKALPKVPKSARMAHIHQFEGACSDGDVNEIKRLIKRNNFTINDYDVGLIAAAENHQIPAMKLLRKMGATDFNGALKVASINGDIEVMKLLRKWGANDYYSAIQLTTPEGRKLLRRWIYSKVGKPLDEVYFDRKWLKDNGF